MAIAEITCTCAKCGTTFRHRKECYNRKEANSYESWAEDHIWTCPECSKIEYIEAAYARATSETVGLPELIGTEKQVRWATSIRADLIRKNDYAPQVAKNLDKIEEFKSSINDSHPYAYRAYAAYRLCTETSAAWFIEHRFSSEREMIK